MIQAKYKAHRFVNYIFYIIVFLLGFFVGTGLKKLNFNNIFNFLLIDDVNAYSFTVGSNTITEEWIVDKLSSQYSDFSVNSFPYIIVQISKNSVSSSVRGVSFLALSEEAYNNMIWSTYGTNGFHFSFGTSSTGNFIFNKYFFSSSSWQKNETHSRNNATDVSPSSFNGNWEYDNTYNRVATDFDIPNISSSLNVNLNQLNFSAYMDNPTLNNGSIFENSSHYDFNKYCWDFQEETLFTVLPNHNLYSAIDLNNYDGKYTFRNGFYSFGYVGNFSSSHNVERGKYTKIWYTPTPNAILASIGIPFSDLSDITHNFDYLTDTQALNSRYYNLFDGLHLYDTLNNDTYYLDNLDLLKYSHYFSSEYSFDATGVYSYNIFKYTPHCEFDLDGIGGAITGNRTCINQNGDEVHLTVLQPFETSLCIYVPKTYNVSILQENSQDGMSGTVLLPNGDVDTFNSSLSIEEGIMPQAQNIFNTLLSRDYGLVRVLQAPLVALNNMSNGVCQPFEINLLGTTLSLPCGDSIFWGRQDVQSFKLWWNMFFGGILCYGLGISIYHSIKSLKDPNDDKVEVIKL